MRVAAVQFKADKGDKSGAIAQLVALTEHAGADADLVVLPEMAATGYVFEDKAAVDTVAEPARGPLFEALSPVAAATQSWIVAGFPERGDDDEFYNSALVIDPTGDLVFTYRKTMLYDDDLPWACPGDSGYRAFDVGEGKGRFTVGICMDLNDDDFVRWCTESDVRAVAFPTNWVAEGHSVWGYWAWRMKETGAALVAANTWGPEAHTAFTGESAVIVGNTVIAAAPEEGDGVIWADL